MEKEIYQKELFEFEQAKRQKPRFGAIFQRPNSTITLTAEKTVFIIIGIIMLMVVFFALGVEKGKSLVPARKSAAQVQPAVPPVATQQIKTAAVAATMPAKGPAPIEPRKALPQTDVSGKPYMIVAAAFLRQDFASKEASRLKTSGFEAFVYYSDPYYLACVGSFVNKDSAQKALSKVRQMHRDAYVRLK